MNQIPSSTLQSSGSIDEQASIWFVRRQGQRMSDQDAEQFQHWLNASPHHKQAYEEIAAVWRACEHIPRPASMVVTTPKRPIFSFWRLLGHTTAALFIAAILFLPYSHLPALLFNNMTLVAASSPKEVTLSDGSQLFLSRDTRIRVAYKTEARQLYLDEGSVYFKVKSNPYRPFIIQVDGRTVRVVGTEFEISRQAQQVIVRVSQGSVGFSNGEGDKYQYLKPGEQIMSAAINGPTLRSRISPQDVARWRFGELIFSDKPLSQIIADLAPYSRLQVELSSADLGESRLSGRINLDSPAQFFQALPALLPVKVVEVRKNNLLIIKDK